MFQKLKKFSHFFSKKTIVLLFLIIFGLGLFLPTVPAQAGFWSTYIDNFFQIFTNPLGSPEQHGLTGIATDFFSGGLSLIISALLTATTPFLVLSYALLNWVTSTGFINISFTGPDNLIVQEGWGIVRDFTNMFIVLGFVIVALATILRIKEYQAQKLLPLLIGIALLINFTPVICGFFIDISNVAMNHFLTAGTLDRSFIETMTYQIGSLFNENLDPGERLGAGIVLVVFNLVATIIFLLFALLFAVRYVALWILIILSPLAFFCYILPALKGVWDMWWKQFFQWCIIGIPAAFFIYLSNMLIGEMSKGNLTSDPTGGLSGFAVLFQYTVPLLFLIVGFFASLQTGAMGADKIIGFAKTGGTQAGRWAGRKAGTFAKERVPAKVLRGAERLSAYSPKSKWGKRAYAVPGWAIRKGAGAVATVTESEKKDISGAREKASGRIASTNLNVIRDPLASKANRIGTLQTAIEKGQIREMKKLGLEKEELESLVIKIGKQALKIDPKEFSKIRDAYPYLAKKIGEGFDENVKERAGLMLDKEAITTAGFKTPTEAIIAGLSAKDIELMDKSTIHDKDAQMAMHKFWAGSQIAAAGKNFGREFIDEFQAFAEEHGRDHYLKPESFNPNVPNYLNSSGAQSLGFSSIGNRIKAEESAPARAEAKNYRTQTLLREVNREDILEKDRKELFLEEREIKPKKEKKEIGGRAGVKKPKEPKVGGRKF